MPKETKERHEKKKGLTDAELIEKYGNLENTGLFEKITTVLLSKPNPNAPAKISKRP
jgi:hypothetical protein